MPFQTRVRIRSLWLFSGHTGPHGQFVGAESLSETHNDSYWSSKSPHGQLVGAIPV